MAALRYVAAALALGLIALWGSEHLFNIAPGPDLTPTTWLLGWAVYALCAAAGLSAVALAGLGGWRGVFLGGAVMGFALEGVITDSMYVEVPLHLVWTPLAWHALVTGLCIFGLGRASVHWRLGRQIAAWAVLGAAVGYFALFWPLKRDDLPGAGAVVAYLLAGGLVVVLAHLVLDRLQTVPRPPLVLLPVAPVLLALIWLSKMLATPEPIRLAAPVMIALTLAVMARLGRPGAAVAFGAAAPLWRHAVFLVAPLVTSVVALGSWALIGSAASDVVVTGLTVPLALALWLGLIGQAGWRLRRVIGALRR